MAVVISRREGQVKLRHVSCSRRRAAPGRLFRGIALVGPPNTPANVVQTAPPCVVSMTDREAAMPAKRTDAAPEAPWPQEPKSLAELNAIIREAGPLVPGATQAVLGEGPEHAEIVMVGEQPGDQEDRQGRPFVGPAGQLLTRAMAEAGLDREATYLTNAVKHFKL